MTGRNVRVVHVGKFYSPSRGGMEKVLQVLAEGERRLLVDSSVLVANDTAATVSECVNGVPVIRVGTVKRVGSVAVCPSFPLWMRRLQADLMVVHEPNPVAIVAHAIARPSVPVILFVHAEVVRPAWRYRLFYRPFLRRMLERASRIIVTSPRMIEIAEELRPYAHKCLTIPLGINVDGHALTSEVAARVEQIKAACVAPSVLFVGRLVPYKGIEYLLRALVELPVRAVVVGDGPLRAPLEALARELGIANRVDFAGEVSSSDLTAFYNACDILVLPSVTKAEAFGMVQLEAMSCRKPVVSTDLPSGVPWVNQHGVTGLVVQPGDVEALTEAMRTLLDNSELRRRMGAAGRQRVETQFGVDRMIASMTSLYHSVLGASPG